MTVAITNEGFNSINTFGVKGLVIPPQTEPIKNLINKGRLFKNVSLKNQFKVVSKDFDVSFQLEFDKSKTVILPKRLSLPLHFEENIITATFTGKFKDNNFITENFFLDLQRTGKTPVSAFLLSSLSAIVRLSKDFEVFIPTFGYNLKTSLTSSNSEISNFLLGRNLAYKLMIIEKATNTKLEIPAFDQITQKDLNEIDYSFQSIIKRKFDLLASHKEPLGTQKEEIVVAEIFRNKVNLGKQLLIFDNKKICIESITTPTLPKNAFSKEIQKLIDLEPKLIDSLFEKHINSFSNAFEGLSDEQIQVLTEHPVLEDEAFNF